MRAATCKQKSTDIRVLGELLLAPQASLLTQEVQPMSTMSWSRSHHEMSHMGHNIIPIRITAPMQGFIWGYNLQEEAGPDAPGCKLTPKTIRIMTFKGPYP